MARIFIHNHLSTPARDVSEGMRGFLERQAARKAKAEEGIAKADKLAGRRETIRREIKRKTKAAGGYLVGGPQGYQLTDMSARIESARAAFGLAINNLSSAYPGGAYEQWMEKGEAGLKLAEDRISSLERLVQSL